jgi:hypothetical protein
MQCLVIGERRPLLSRFLLRKPNAPWLWRASAFWLAVVASWAVLGVAGVGFAVTLSCGAGIGLVAQEIAEWWWLHREHRRDLANGYVQRRQDGEP